MAFFIIFLISAIVVILVSCIINSHNSSTTQTSQIQVENARAITNWRQKRKEAFDTWIKGMENKYGKIGTMVSIVPSETQKTLLVFQERKEIYISSTWLKFDDIITSKITDSPHTTPGTITAITEKDIWNEVKRSSMQRSFGKTTGTWLAGPEKYVTEYQKTPDIIHHNYSVLIGTSNISNPLVEIKIGEDSQIAQRINAIINVIITNQNKEEQ